MRRRALRSAQPWALAGVALAMAARPVLADDLSDAIALAYESNPTLLSQRAQLQGTDEGFVQAMAGFRPTVSLQTSAGYSKTPQSELFFGVVETESNTGAASVSVNQPIYTGGRTTAEVRAAEAQIRAGREQLRSVEAGVLFAVIQAYSDVMRDRTALAVQKESLTALVDEVAEIRARHDAGATTVIDVRQADAQLETARALVASAEAQLGASVAEYVAAVGRSPGDLAPPPPLAAVPPSIETAYEASERESPVLRHAEFAEAASRAQVQQARAAFRPTVGISGAYGYQGALQPLEPRAYDRAVSVTATLTQPIYSGGVLASQARQALAQDTSARLDINAARRAVIQAVTQAWTQARAARLNIAAQTAAVQAAQETFDGMRVEYRAGLRATLDVLIAEETLRDARISLAGAVHDEYVAEASLMQAVGRLEARVLLQGLPLYRPEVSFRRVEHSGDLPWQVVPETLDRIGAPALPAPGPLPEGLTPTGPVRMTPPAATDQPLETAR